MKIWGGGYSLNADSDEAADDGESDPVNPYTTECFTDDAKAPAVTAVSIPASVKSIDPAFFQLFPNAAQISVAADSATYTAHNGMLFNKERTDLLLVPEGMEGAAVLPESIASVPACVFSRCFKLSAIDVPTGGAASARFAARNGILYTADLATLVAAPAGIGASVSLAAECTAIAEGAFWGNADLQTIVVNGTVETIVVNPGFDLANAATAADKDIPAFDPVVIQDATVALTGDFNKAAWEAAGFTNFTQPAQPGAVIEPVEGSGFAFDLLEDYTLAVRWQGADPAPAAVHIPAFGVLDGAQYAVTRIADQGFAGQTGMVTVDMPDTITAVGAGAFEGCTGLQTANLANAITLIGARAFADTALLGMVLPTSLETVGAEAFAGLTGAIVVAPTQPGLVADSAFAGGTGLSLYVPVREDGTYSMSAGLPASGNHLYPYGVQLGDDAVELTEGQTANLFQNGGKLEAPGQVQVDYAYKARPISIDTETGDVEAKQIGSSDVRVSLTLDVPTAYVKGIVSDQVRLKKAGLGSETEEAGSDDVFACQQEIRLASAVMAYNVAASPVDAPALLSIPRTDTSIASGALPTVNNQGTAYWMIDAEYTLTIGCTDNAVIEDFGWYEGDISLAVGRSVGFWRPYKDIIEKIRIEPGVKAESCREWFAGLSKLRDISEFYFPEQTRSLRYMFSGCGALGVLPEKLIVPDTVESMYSLFSGCAQIEELPEGFNIPYGVTEARALFQDCTGLKRLADTFTIPDTLVDLRLLLDNCKLLEYLPSGMNIPATATNISEMLDGCTNLKALPEGFRIPATVKQAYCAFRGCDSLTKLPAGFAIPDVPSCDGGGKAVYSSLLDDPRIFSFNGQGSGTATLTYEGYDQNTINYNWAGANRALTVSRPADHSGEIPTVDNVGKAWWAVSADGKVLTISSINGGIIENNSDWEGTNNVEKAFAKTGWWRDYKATVEKLIITPGTAANSCHGWFADFSKLKDISEFRFPEQTTSLRYIFAKCPMLSVMPTYMKVPDTVTNMYDMFEGCESMTGLPADFNISPKTTTVRAMFLNCTSLKKLPDDFAFPDSITDVRLFVAGCTALEKLPKGVTIPSKVTEMSEMARDCTNLTEISPDFTIPSTVSSPYLAFSGCNSLKEIPAGFSMPDKEVWTFNGTNLVMGNLLEDPGIFAYTGTGTLETIYEGYDENVLKYVWGSAKRTLKSSKPADRSGELPTVDNVGSAWWVVSDDLKTLTITSAGGGVIANLGWNPGSETGASTLTGRWRDYRASIEKIIITPGTKAQSCQAWFSGFTNLIDLKNFRFPEETTSLRYVFSQCSSISEMPEYLEVPSTVTNMWSAFSGCKSIKAFPSDFDIPDGTTCVRALFNDCSSLTALPSDLTVPSTVDDMRLFVAGCTSLKSLPAGAIAPDGVLEMSEFARGCSSLMSLPDGFTIPTSVIYIYSAFSGCNSLVTIPDSIDLSVLTNVEGASGFAGVFKATSPYVAGASSTDLLPTKATDLAKLLPPGVDAATYPDAASYWKQNYGRQLATANEKITLTWDLQGGSVSGSTAAVSKTQTYTGTGKIWAIPANPTRTNYKFEGWFTEENGQGEMVGTWTDLPYKDTTYYAYWIASYTVQFDLNADADTTEPASIADIAVESGGYINMPPAVKRLGHWRFYGWQVAEVNGAAVSDGAVFAADQVVWADTWHANSGDTVVIKALWNPIISIDVPIDDKGNFGKENTVNLNIGTGQGEHEAAEISIRSGSPVDTVLTAESVTEAADDTYLKTFFTGAKADDLISSMSFEFTADEGAKSENKKLTFDRKPKSAGSNESAEELIISPTTGMNYITLKGLLKLDMDTDLIKYGQVIVKTVEADGIVPPAGGKLAKIIWTVSIK